MAHRIVDENSLKTVADAIREKAGTSDSLVFPTGFAEAIAGIQAGGGSDEEWFNDGDTHIWITLPEGRTSPMLGVCPNGTVTVDWGDGTTPDTLTGTSLTSTKWTPTHNYAEPGDYVITLAVDGEMIFYGNKNSQQYSAILRFTNGQDYRNEVYQNAVNRVEIGQNVNTISKHAFHNCHSLASVVIPESVTSIGDSAFESCYSLKSVSIPDSVTSIGYGAFIKCRTLSNVSIPDSVTSIGGYAFNGCTSLSNLDMPEGVTGVIDATFGDCYSLSSFVIPSGITAIKNNAFTNCYSLKSVVIPEGVTTIDNGFNSCHSLTNLVIPESVTSIVSYCFSNCRSLTTVVIPSGVTSIANGAFSYCYGMVCYDFSSHLSVPTLGGTGAFSGIQADCEIRVPAALYDEWIAATNWSTYASNIVAV